MTDLLALAQRIADSFPDVVEEVVVTGSVSRRMTDEVSDIEMLVVTREQLTLEEAFELGRGAGLEGELGSWGVQDVPTKRVSGYRDGVPIELIFWERTYADEQIEAYSSSEAIAHGVALRSNGNLERWQAFLSAYPEELALERIDEAALTWGGFAPEGLLTLTREGDRFTMIERMVDDTQRVMKMLWAINRKWPPTNKRLAQRESELAVKPDRLAARIEEAFAEPNQTKAVLLMTQLQLDTVNLAPDTPNVVRARDWLARGVEILESR
jgi:hypothetical protein